MADGHSFKRRHRERCLDVKFVPLSRQECPTSVVQPDLPAVVVTAVEDHVDVGIGAGPGTRPRPDLQRVGVSPCVV